MNIIMRKGGVSMEYSGSDNSYGRNNNMGSSFALLVVLFILLIIIGATFMNKSY